MSRKKISAFLLVIALAWLSVATINNRNNVSAQSNNSQDTDSKFQPGVEDFLRSDFGNLSATEVPDPGETLEVLQSYRKFRNSPKELENFRFLVQQNPNSRLARAGLAKAYYNRYRASRNRQDAVLALQEQLEAARIAFSHGKIFYTAWIKQMALDAGQPEVASQWFEQVLAQDPNNYDVNLNYGQLLAAIGDNASADQLFLKAIDVRSTGNLDAHVTYAEFLLNTGRYQDALNYTTLVGERAFYLDFLHGYALERLGRGSEAVRFYQRFVEMSRDFPASRRFQILGSPYQRGIIFEGDKSVSDSISLKENKSVRYLGNSYIFHQ